MVLPWPSSSPVLETLLSQECTFHHAVFLCCSHSANYYKRPICTVRNPHGVHMLLLCEVSPCVNLESRRLAGVSLRFEVFKVSWGLRWLDFPEQPDIAAARLAAWLCVRPVWIEGEIWPSALCVWVCTGPQFTFFNTVTLNKPRQITFNGLCDCQVGSSRRWTNLPALPTRASTSVLALRKSERASGKMKNATCVH